MGIDASAVCNIDTMRKLEMKDSGLIGSYYPADSTFAIYLYERDTIATFKLNNENTNTIACKIKKEYYNVKAARCVRSYFCDFPYEYK